MSDRNISTPIHVGAEPPRPEAFADFVDGRSAAVRRVMFELDDAGRRLIIRPPEAEPILWPLGTLRRLPDQADASRLVLTSTGHPLARLTLADPGAIAMLAARARRIDARQPVRGTRRVIAWAAAAAASVALIIFVLVPVMADQLARVLPPRGELALGEATLGQIQSALSDEFSDRLPVCAAAPGQEAMNRMLARLEAGGLGLPYPVKVTVLDHGMVNAFALPGGQVVFFRGLIDAATDPDQVAAVLAHEIGHVAARDPTRIALRSAGSLCVLGLLFGDFAGGAAVLFLVEQLIQSNYTREAEEAADAFGIDLLLAAGIDPAALADLFQLMRDRYGDTEGIAAHFASHPSLGDRIAKSRLAGAGAGSFRPSLSEIEWQALRGICEG